MKTKVKLYKIKSNPDNPRIIKDNKFYKLVESLIEFPEMLEKRPIVVDEDFVVLGGNMRLKACKEAGINEVWIDIAKGWSEERKREFIIKDNVNFGEWDWDLLANEWDSSLMENWGLDVIKHDWEQLDYIDEDVKNETFDKDEKIVITLCDNCKEKKKEIIYELNQWLAKHYKGCEIK